MKFVLGNYILDTTNRRFPLEPPAELAEPAATIWVFLKGAQQFKLPIDPKTKAVIKRTYPDFAPLLIPPAKPTTIRLRDLEVDELSSD